MRVQESLARDALRLAIWYPFRWLLQALPLEAGFAALRALGRVHARLARGGARALQENLGRLSGAIGAPDQIIRDYYVNHYVDRLFLFLAARFDRRAVDRMIEWEGLEHLEAALAKGSGAVLVHGHFGPVHIPLVALARRGHRLKQVGLPSDEGLSWVGRQVAFRLRMKLEGRYPTEIIRAGDFPRPVFRWLKENGVVMITGDGTGTATRVGRHERFLFCGQPVDLPLGPALLAQKTGAALLPLFIEPGKERAFRVIVEEPLPAGDAATVTAEFVRRLEARVRRNPAWMHFLDRFRPGDWIATEKCDAL